MLALNSPCQDVLPVVCSHIHVRTYFLNLGTYCVHAAVNYFSPLRIIWWWKLRECLCLSKLRTVPQKEKILQDVTQTTLPTFSPMSLSNFPNSLTHRHITPYLMPPAMQDT